MEKVYGQMKKNKYCMLEDDKICENCLECHTCDVDATKLCDNCAKCIDSDCDFRVIEIDEIGIEQDLKKKLKLVDQQKSVKIKRRTPKPEPS